MELNSDLQAGFSRPLDFFSKYPAEMSEWYDRLQEAFEETGWTMAELARRSGVSYDLVTKYLAGKVKQPRGDVVDKLAGALQLDPDYLARGVQADAPRSSSIPIVGYLGAGAVVEPDYEQVPPEGLDHVDLPFAIPDDLIAFRVRGTSMQPVYRDGSTIVVYREQKRPIESFYGEEAAVRTSDGRRFIKTITRGTGPNTVNLLSWNDPVPIESVRLLWIGEIFTVMPPSRSGMAKAARQGGIQGQLPLRRHG